MMTEQQMRAMMEMWNNPLYQQGMKEFAKIAQQQGMEAAGKFWGMNPSTPAAPTAEGMMTQMAGFYQSFGFVTQAKYDEAVKENLTLKNENQVLREALRDLQQRYTSEHGAKAQQAWQDIVSKQLDMSREVTKSFFDVLKQTTPPKGE